MHTSEQHTLVNVQSITKQENTIPVNQHLDSPLALGPLELLSRAHERKVLC